MQPRKSDWADSVRAWASGYKDSVVVDMHYDNETGFENIYVHKDNINVWRGGAKDNSNVRSAAWQYYIVPAFIAIIFAYVVFGSLLMNDNAKALKNGDRGTILGMLNKKKNERRI